MDKVYEKQLFSESLIIIFIIPLEKFVFNGICTLRIEKPCSALALTFMILPVGKW